MSTKCRHVHRTARALTAIAVAMAMPAIAQADPVACNGGKILVGEECLTRESLASRIDEIVRKAIADKDLKSVIAGISIDGAPVLTKAWGESMTGVPATPDMHFRSGSIAIAYLGVVTLQLQDKGRLSLEDKLSKWFPEYPKADRITLAMLLNGTSGYADYVNLKILPLYQNPFRSWQPDELIALGLKQPMVCEPGTCFAYAHTNFVILGKVLEKVSGRGVDELIRDGILVPLALNDTRSVSTAEIEPPVLHAFDAERGIYEDSTYWNPSWTLARGAVMNSNVHDLLKSATALGTGALISPESFKLQLAPTTSKFKPWSETSYYGLGIVVIDGWIVQNPSFAGYAATMAYLPGRKLAIAVSATMGETAPEEGNLSTVVLKEIARYRGARSSDALKPPGYDERRSIRSTSETAIGRPKKIAPTRAKRSGESVAKNRTAPLGSAVLLRPAAISASATACAVVSAESTTTTAWPMVSLMASASTGKWVQPSTSVSGAAGPSNKGAR